MPSNKRRKEPTFEDVEAIYNSLPEAQQRLVNPHGPFVDSPFLAARYVSPDKSGFGEAYRLPQYGDDEAFVALAVRPERQGKGEGKEILKRLAQEAKKRRIKTLLYRAANTNEASKRLATSFAGNEGEPDEEEGYTRWSIPVPVTPVTKKRNDALKDVVKKYKEKYGIDLSDMKLENSDIPRYPNGRSAADAIDKGKYAGSWGLGKKIYLNPDMSEVIKNYGLDTDEDTFTKRIIVHELAHEVEHRGNKELVDEVLKQVEREKFTTPYLSEYDKKDKKYNSEAFAEYIASKMV